MIFVLNLVGMITNLLWKQCAIQVCFPSLASASKQDNAEVVLVCKSVFLFFNCFIYKTFNNIIWSCDV